MMMIPGEEEREIDVCYRNLAYWQRRSFPPTPTGAPPYPQPYPTRMHARELRAQAHDASKKARDFC